MQKRPSGGGRGLRIGGSFCLIIVPLEKNIKHEKQTQTKAVPSLHMFNDSLYSVKLAYIIS